MADPRASKRPDFRIGQVLVQRIIDLRWRILRAGLDRSTAIFDGDDLPTTRHVAALRGRRVIGCATILLNTWKKEPAWQLRGMAVEESAQGQGVGRTLLLAVEQLIREQSDIRLMWCNARLAAMGFYGGMGWDVASGRFHIPSAGPHYKMIRRL